MIIFGEALKNSLDDQEKIVLRWSYNFHACTNSHAHAYIHTHTLSTQTKTKTLTSTKGKFTPTTNKMNFYKEIHYSRRTEQNT